jgi:transposase InsO family protein
VIPFGLCNAPASFQNYINDTLGKDILDRFVSAYLDDILIFSNSLGEHRQHVKTVLKRLTIAGLQLDISKCEFEVHETKYLGMIIQSRSEDGKPGQIRMDPEKVAAIREWETPRNAKEIQSFIIFANFYRRFIKDFSKTALPLTKLTRKNVPFEWTQEAGEAFQTLKNAFTSSPVLQHFDPDLACTIETDASDDACGGVLFQPNHEGILQPVAYFSKRHSPAESNYEIYDKELMAIVRAFEEWRPELEGSPEPIDVVTDHRNLEYFMTSKQLSRRQARWSEFLSRFDFVIKYRPGSQYRADGLSRRPQDKAQDANDDRKKFLEQVVLKPKNLDSAVAERSHVRPIQPTWILRRHERIPELSESPETPANDDSPLPATEQPRTSLEEDIAVAYQNLAREDPCRVTRQQVLSGERRSMIVTLADCSVENEKLYYRGRLWIPENEDLRYRCVKECHEQPMVGHPGPRRTYEILQRQFYWPKMMDMVKEQLAKCSVCSRTKPSRERHGQLQALEPPKKRWQHLAMDFVTDLPESNGIFPGATSIWVLTDRFTKERHLAPCHSMKKEHLVRMFIHFVVRTHGLPESIVSDRGPQFVSEFWQCLCKRLGIKAKLSTAHHPETDGQSERVNQAMETYLRSYVNYMQDDWAEWIPLAEFAMNNYVSEATRMSPFYVNKGFNPRMSFEQLETNLDPQAEDISGFMKELLEHCHAELVWTQARTTDAANRNQHRHPAPVYRVGDRVWLNSKNIRTRRPCRKLDDKWIGPFEVKRTIGSTACELNLPTALRIFPVFHVSMLRPCEAETAAGAGADPQDLVVCLGATACSRLSW